jgi:hypothetical protein
VSAPTRVFTTFRGSTVRVGAAGAGVAVTGIRYNRRYRQDDGNGHGPSHDNEEFFDVMAGIPHRGHAGICTLTVLRFMCMSARRAGRGEGRTLRLQVLNQCEKVTPSRCVPGGAYAPFVLFGGQLALAMSFVEQGADHGPVKVGGALVTLVRGAHVISLLPAYPAPSGLVSAPRTSRCASCNSTWSPQCSPEHDERDVTTRTQRPGSVKCAGPMSRRTANRRWSIACVEPTPMLPGRPRAGSSP